MAALCAVSARPVVAFAGAKSQKQSGFCTGARVTARSKPLVRARLPKSTLKVRLLWCIACGIGRREYTVDPTYRAFVTTHRSRATHQSFGIDTSSFRDEKADATRCVPENLPTHSLTPPRPSPPQAGRVGLVVRASDVDDELAAVSAAVEVRIRPQRKNQTGFRMPVASFFSREKRSFHTAKVFCAF